jgi:hypothetical protein
MAISIRKKPMNKKNKIVIVIIMAFVLLTSISVYRGYGKLLQSILPIKSHYIWSIGIYEGDDPFNFNSYRGINNPVLTGEDVNDIDASSVADPFMVKENQNWYMFFEVMDKHRNKGEIGLATSQDGLHWDYKQIVLKEPFHLSYPYVFRWGKDYYMIPESYQAKAIRLYKAIDFPKKWVFVKNILTGYDYVDSCIFFFNHKWWLISSSTTNDNMLLYFANKITGPWIKHPKSPIIQGNPHIARAGGRVLVFEDKVIRYSQDDEPTYGKQVWAFEITRLTTTEYIERKVKEKPIITASAVGWNATGMHNIDPIQINSHKWVACVDGKRKKY